MHPPPSVIYTLSLHDALPISFLTAACMALASFQVRARGFSQAMAFLASAAAMTISGWALLGTATSTRSMSGDRKSTRLNSSHVEISYAVFCLKKKKYKAHENT